MKFNVLYKNLLEEAKRARQGNILNVNAVTSYIYFPREDELFYLTPHSWELVIDGAKLTDKEGNNPSEEIKEYFPRGYTKTRAALGKDIMNFWPDSIVFPEEEDYHFVAQGKSFPDNKSEIVLIEPNDKYSLDQETRDQWGDILTGL